MTKQHLIQIGKVFGTDKTIWLDKDVLMETRFGCTASSRWGKSHLFRVIFEQSYRIVQQIIIDPEGEYPSLRKLQDSNYIIIGKGDLVDIQISIKIAEHLALKLMEENASAIIDLSSLSRTEKLQFVTIFTNTLADIPQRLWNRECIVAIDETHKFAPEKPKKGTVAFDCIEALTNLADSGGKRGICLMVATQRLAKLEKDVFAECDNKMVGHTSYNDDRKRGAEELGDKSITESLKTLPKGEFFCTGAAFVVEGQKGVGLDDVVHVKVDDVLTKHDKRGEKAAFIPPKNENVIQLLKRFENITEVAEKELKTKQDLESEIARLNLELRKKAMSGSKSPIQVIRTGPTEEQVKEAQSNGYKLGWTDCWTEWNKFVSAVPKDLEMIMHKIDQLFTIRTTVGELQKSFNEKLPLTHPPISYTPKVQTNTAFVPKKIISPTYTGMWESAPLKLSPSMLDFLAFLASMPNRPLPKSLAFQAAKISSKSSLRGTAVKALKDMGLIIESDNQVQINIQKFPDIIRLLGSRYHDKSTMTLDEWEQTLSGSTKKIFAVIRQSTRLDRDSISIEAGISPTSSGLGTSLAELQALGLIEKENDEGVIWYRVSRQIMEMVA